jgi:hypothetical protein
VRCREAIRHDVHASDEMLGTRASPPGTRMAELGTGRYVTTY